MSGYQPDEFCQEHVLYDFFTNTPVPVSGLAGDVIVLINRASTPAQATAHASKFAHMEKIIGNARHRIIKKTFNMSGVLKPIYAYNETNGLNHGYRNAWFGSLEDTIDEALRHCFPGRMVSIVMLTPDRFARSRYFHPHNEYTWELTNADYEQIDTWLTAIYGDSRRRFRLLTCFAGTPRECRGLQSKIGMDYSGKHNGRPKGSVNKKPRMYKLSPKEKTALGKLLRSELPYLIGELELNGTQCYNYLKAHHGGSIPFRRETVCRWVVTERGTPGKPGKPAAKSAPPKPENKCGIFSHRYNCPIEQCPVLSRGKRTWSIVKSLLSKRVKLFNTSLLQSIISKSQEHLTVTESHGRLSAHNTRESLKKSNGITIGAVAKRCGVSKSQMQRAGMVKRRASESIYQAVRNGTLSLYKAISAIKRAENETGIIVTASTLQEDRRRVFEAQERFIWGDVL